GWGRLAERLLDKSRLEATDTPGSRLVGLAWDYWTRQLLDPRTDRARAGKRLKELIRQHKDLDTQDNRTLLRSLDLALLPRKGKPGTVEALIEELVDCCADMETGEGFEREEHYLRIVRLGFDAVPALIDHLDDDRLTRTLDYYP